MAKAQEASTGIELPPIDRRTMAVTIIGDTSLICNCWSEKAKQQMRDKQQKKARAAREAKDPEADFKGSLYHLPGGKFGFPTIGLKASAIAAARFVEGLKMTFLRGAFHIDAEMAEIDGAPEMREDMVRVGMGAADLRYRGEFKAWKITFNVTFNAAVISAEQVMHLFNVGGFSNGIGEWRPEKDGGHGRYHVATGDELAA